MAGAKEFLDDLRSRYQVIILSDTFVLRIRGPDDAATRPTHPVLPPAGNGHRRLCDELPAFASPIKNGTQ